MCISNGYASSVWFGVRLVENFYSVVTFHVSKALTAHYSFLFIHFCLQVSSNIGQCYDSEMYFGASVNFDMLGWRPLIMMTC